MDTFQNTVDPTLAIPQVGSPSLTPVRLDKDGNVDLSLVTPQEVQQYSEINKDLKPGDANSILNYGVEAQASMERYSNQFLTSVRTYNSGEVGTLITDLLAELNYIDVDELETNPVKKFFSNRLSLSNKIADN